MVKIRLEFTCWKSNSIRKPLKIIYKEYLNLGLFPFKWKIKNIVSTYKTGAKQCLKEYRPVSLLPICGKILKKLIFDKMFQFLLKINLLQQNKTGFKPGDSCINYLQIMIFINHLRKGMRPEKYSLVYPKHLIRSGTKVLFLN